MSEINKYRCVHCKKIMERESSKRWIKSFCNETGKRVRLQKLEAEND